MLNRTDKIMLASLITVTLSSTGLQYYGQTPSPEKAVSDTQDDTLYLIVEEPKKEVPDFTRFMDVREKKSAFFAFMMPLIEKENKQILSNRRRILELSEQKKLSATEQQWLADIAKRYRMADTPRESPTFFHELLSRVDMIPLSLALVQSANESAWGTSRFAIQGNNFFGQWCFSKGCGIVPNSRPKGEIYEVRKFDSVAESVRAYMHNLNTHHQYDAMRELRQSRRQYNQAITGPVLAQGLYAYSIRGLEYVEELVAMIASNDLLRYDLSKGVRSES